VSKEKGVVMREEWKQIEGAEDGYMVSNLGRVKGIRKPIMGQHDNGIGYLQCKIKMRDGKARFLKVHRMVAIAFIPNPYGLSDVNHIDGDKQNNRADNLEWVTHGDNIRKGWENGQFENAREVFRANRSGAAARRVAVRRSDGVVFESQTAAADALGVNQSCICDVLRGRQAACKGYTFERLEGEA
jgi:hypothetical protein